jgi:hypothetical protein
MLDKRPDLTRLIPIVKSGNSGAQRDRDVARCVRVFADLFSLFSSHLFTQLVVPSAKYRPVQSTMHTRSTSKRLRVDSLIDKENQHASQAAKKARLEVARPTSTPAANTSKRHLQQDVSSVAARTALWVHEVSNAAGNARAVQVRSSKDEDVIGDKNDCKVSHYSLSDSRTA